MTQKVDFDPNTPITADVVDGLEVGEILQRLGVLNKEADSVLTLSNMVAKVPSIRGVAQVWNKNTIVASELYLLADAIQRRMTAAADQIATLKK